MGDNFKIEFVTNFGNNGRIISKLQRKNFINKSGQIEFYESKVFNIVINNMLVSDNWFDIYTIDNDNGVINCIVGFKNTEREFKFKQNIVNYVDDNGDISLLYQYSYGVINSNGIYIMQPIYDKISRNNEYIYTVYYDGKAGYVSKIDGIHITPIIFDNPGRFYNGLASIEYKGKTGYVSRERILVNPDNNDEYAIFPQYEWGDDFENGYARVETVDETLIIDQNNQVYEREKIKKYLKE